MKRIMCLCLVLTLCLCLCACQSSDYKEAVALYEAGEYEAAITAFEALGDYEDSVQKIADCKQAIAECELAIRYNGAVALMDAGDYEEAIVAFEALDDYRDSVTQIENCNTAIMDNKYNNAVALMDQDLVKAFEALVALDGYKDSAGKADSLYEQYSMEKIKAANVGDYIPIGTYEQDNNHANGKEYVEWLVLDKKDNKMLVISRYALDCQPYEDDFFKRNLLWKNCSLREWINDTFWNTAFSSAEQSVIAKLGQDKVFLLSLSEVYEYLTADNARQCTPTAFAVANGVEIIDYGSSICRWWLREDVNRNYVMAADFSEYTLVRWEWPVFTNGIGICPALGVRPAMWISVESR